MSKLEKLLIKLNRNPRSFDFKDTETLLKELGFKLSNKGKTSGSKIIFYKDDLKIALHKPHPRKELLPYQIKIVKDAIKELINDEIR